MTHRTNRTATNSTQASESTLPTFLEHFQELKGRLFWVAVFFVLFASATYPFVDKIIKLIVAPIGDQKLYYTTPAGGLAFVIKVCMYVGLVAVLPVLVYHLYKFIAPVVHQRKSRTVLGYTVASILLACAGVTFVYFVSLPAALHFLTTINLGQINPLITIDSYISFVMAYLLAGVLLFQLPLILLIINSVTPLSPKKLFGFQRYVIVGAFVLAAIISPTPDVINQTFLAGPMIIMYQLGVVVVWLRQRSIRRKARSAAKLQHRSKMQQRHGPKQDMSKPQPSTAPVYGQVHAQRTAPATSVRPRTSIDGILSSRDSTSYLAQHYQPRKRL